MQESVEFEVKTPFETISKSIASDLVKKLLEEKEKELGIYLSYYFKEEGGLVEQVRLSDKINFLAPYKGNFRVNFKVIYHNACWNIHCENRDEMLIEFNYNPLHKKIKFTGPLWPEREPDEI